MISRLRAFLIATIFAVLPALAPAHAADNTVDGWKLQQWERENGIVDLYISKSAVRIVNEKNGLCLLASAPWKETNLYCTKTGNIFKSPTAKFRSPYLSAMAMFDGGSFAEINVVLKGETKCLDIPAKTYIEPPSFSQHQLAKHKSGIIANRAPYKLEFVVTDYFKVDPHVGQVICQFYALPLIDAVPLQLKYTTMKSIPEKQLTTASFKKVKCKLSDFALPSGLKTVTDGREVLVPSNEDGALDLMMMGRSKVK